MKRAHKIFIGICMSILFTVGVSIALILGFQLQVLTVMTHTMEPASATVAQFWCAAGCQ